MTKRLKNILLITFSAFLALSAALMLALTSSRANKTYADEEYREYWIIRENAVYNESTTISVPFSYKVGDGNSARYNSIIINSENSVFDIAYHDGELVPLYAYTNNLSTGTSKYFSPLSGVNTADGVDYETFKNGTGFLTIYSNSDDDALLGYSMSQIASRYSKITIKTTDGEVINDGLYTGYYVTDLDGNIENAVSAYEKPGYTYKGLSLDQSGAELLDMTTYVPNENEVTLYAVYEENPSEEPTGGDTTDEKPTLGDKINEVTDNIASWLKDNTGLAFSSGGVILLAVVLALILFKRR